MRSIFYARTVLVAVLFVAASVSLRAQTLPPPSSVDQQGMQPYQSYNGGDIDSISLSTGMLNLNVPFLSYPQRGALHLSFNLFYNDQPQHYGEFCVSLPTGQSCTNIWGYAPGGGALPLEGGDPVVGWAQQIGLVNTDPKTVTNSGKSTQFTSYYSDLFLQTADGAKHPLGNLGTLTQTGSFPNFYYSASGPWESLDATAWRLNGSFTAPGSLEVTLNVPGAVGPDGVTYGTINEDTNGNQIVLNGSNLTDSLGRAIPLPPTASTASNTDTSTCSQAPLAVDHAVLWTVPGPNGGTVAYKFCYAKVTLNMPPVSPGSYAKPSAVAKLQSIVLPNGQSWDFQYNDPGDGSTYGGTTVNYGTLTQVTLPTGGTISYTYTQLRGALTCNNGGRWVASRVVNDGAGAHTWTYSYNLVSGSVGSSTTVTDPLGNYTVHTFGFGGACSLYETQTQYYQVGGSLLKTVATAYSSSSSRNVVATPVNVVPTQVTITWPNGKISQTTKAYDAGYTYTDAFGSAGNSGIYGKILSESAYDYGNNAVGPLLRTTKTNYYALSNSGYLTNNLLSLPSSVQVLDSGGTQRAYTTYSYDENNGSPQGACGNLTSTHRWLNTTGGYLVTSSIYNSNGLVVSTTDPKNNTTTFGYSGAYGGTGPTSVTNALNQTTSHSYDLNTGLLMSTTDPNNQTTSFTYDSLWRLGSASYPDGGSSVITRQESTFPFSATLTKKITSSQNYSTTNVFDGLGRVSQTQLADPQGIIYTITTYDADGRKYQEYNPTRCNPPTTNCGEPTWGVTTYTTYDGLGRVELLTKPDGSTVQTAYCGPTTLVTDEAGKWRRSTTDGLGRLIEVDEPNSTTATVASTGCPGTGEPIWVTTYAYDALDDLTTVVQSGSHNRTFAYDSLKHLTSSTNPEAGTVTYGYDLDGNLMSKADARGITITYSYDPLNRMTGRTYSNGDPSVTYSFDQSTCLAGETACYNIGRRTSMTDGGGSEAWSYDKMGREWGEQRTTNSVTTTASYSYNFDGSLAALTYPSGRTITYTTDSAGRASEAVDVANGINYATGTCANGVNNKGTCYAPHGAVSSLALGQAGSFAGIILADTYNKRLQPNELKVSSSAGTAMDLTYNFNLAAGDNGNVVGITNNKDTTRSQSFTYDQVNRIVTAGTSSATGGNCWGETYTMDQWANLTSIAAASGYTGCTQESGLSVSATTNNQLSATGLAYDAAGNMTGDGAYTYGFNAESEISTAAGLNYYYDGDGNRLEKCSHFLSGGAQAAVVGCPVTKIYWYGAGTEILDESDASGNFTDEYVFFGGKRITHRAVSSGAITYYAEDLLGSSRVMTTSTGSVCYDADFYPYGGERVITNTCAQNYKFEGKERDTETSNDNFGARYYSSRLGRWLSADWSAVPAPVPYANFANPQSLNLYAMVRDNPSTFADLDGHYLLAGSGCGDNAKCQKKFDKAAEKFEKQRERNLKSKKADVRAAAANFGGRGEANGVFLNFKDLGPTIHGSVDSRGSVNGSAALLVEIDFSRAGSSETITHEGTHIGDDMKFLSSYNLVTGGYDQSLNITHFQSEFNAFKAGAEVNHEHGFGPNDTQKIGDYIRANYPPALLPKPIFDPALFPAGAPHNEQ